MKILILHRVPYYKIDYHRGINHDEHEVTYIGTKEKLSDIPAWINCNKIERLGLSRAYVEVLSVLGKKAKFDRIISISEYELMDAAQLRVALGVSGPTPNEVEKVRDKIVMKEAVSKAGIRCPKNMRGNEALVCTLPNWSGFTVLKPVDGASSQDVNIHQTFEEALKQLTHYLLHGKSLIDFEVEEFIDGPILHMDGLVSQGKIKCFIASKYIGTCLDYAKGLPLGSYQIEYTGELEAWAQECITAVGITNSAFHLEAILSEDGLVFLEIGARVGGADVVDTFELATGVHLPSEELKLYLNQDVNISSPLSFQKQFGWFVVPGHHLDSPFLGMIGFEKFKENKKIVRWNELAIGTPLLKSITYQSREVPLAGLIEGSSSREVKELIEQIFQNISK